jgi:hypothetical protein
MSYEDENPDARRGGRLVTFAVALVAVLVLAGGIWFAYDRGLQRGGQNGPPLIKADESPTKVAPVNPGGLQVPNQDIEVYGTVQRGGQVARPGVERLLPPPERPLPDAPRAQAAEPPTTTATAPPPADASRSPSADAVVPPPAPAKGPEVASGAAPPPAPAVAGTAAPASPAGGIRVQLAAHRDRSLAEAEWARLQKRHAEILSGLAPTYERADLGDRGIFIRVQAGPFRDRAAALAVCERLKAVKQGCSVVGK